MQQVLSAIQTELPTVPIGTEWKQAVPIVITTLIVALVGGGIIHGLGRHRSYLLRIITVGVFTLLVATGLVIALIAAYDPFNAEMPQ